MVVLHLQKNGATKAICLLESLYWWIKDQRNFLWWKSEPFGIKKKLKTLNFKTEKIVSQKEKILYTFLPLSHNALPDEEETAHMWFWFLSYRGSLNAWIWVSWLHCRDPCLQIPGGHGGVQTEWHVVWPGYTCHIQGETSGLQGETPSQLNHFGQQTLEPWNWWNVVNRYSQNTTQYINK